MLNNYFRNKKMVKQHGYNDDDDVGYDNEGSLIEDILFQDKNKNYFLIRHIQFADENKELTNQGIYKIFNNNEKSIGNLKYVLKNDDSGKAYMHLCDICFDPPYRNIGLGSKTIELFEKRAKAYDAQYIIGELSDVDEQTQFDEVLRNEFYKRRGYDILNNKKIYKKLIG